MQSVMSEADVVNPMQRRFIDVQMLVFYYLTSKACCEKKFLLTNQFLMRTNTAPANKYFQPLHAVLKTPVAVATD